MTDFCFFNIWCNYEENFQTLTEFVVFGTSDIWNTIWQKIDVFNMNDDFVKFSENLTHCSSKSKIMSLTCKVGAGKIFICLDYFHSDSCFLTFKNHIICQKNTKLWNNYFLTSNFYIDSFVYLFKERSKSLLKVEIFK
jgi:hypothetical protein